MRRRRIRGLLAALVVLAAPGLAAGAAASVEQPRAFGHVIGDVLTQRVLLQADGRAFEPAALPRAERVGVWLERRTPRIDTATDGRRWLVIEYQIVNAPQALRTVSLPAWRLESRAGGAPLEIGDWAFSVAPLTPRAAFAAPGMGPLRPDRPAPQVDTGAFERRLGLAGAGLALTLAAWLGWVLARNWRAAAHQPFARAWREMRRVDEAAPEAWQALHRAFDRTAGRVVQPASLPALFQRAPQLEAQRPAIEAFYLASSARFFGTAPVAGAPSVRALCRALRRIEKRHER